MPREERLSHLYEVLSELSYPIDRDEATDEVADIRMLLADGTIELDEVIAELPSETFDDQDALTIDIMSNLPRRAVGEPYQSEGEG